MFSDEEIFFMYGKNIVISRKGSFVLIHMDHPSGELLRARTEEFDPDAYFCDDCPLCRVLRGSGIIVFDDSIFEDDDI